MRMNAHLQHPQPAGPGVLPERLVPFHVPVTAEDVVHEEIESAPLALDARDQLGNRGRVFVIDHERRPRVSRSSNQVSSLLDGLGPADLRRPPSPAAATSRVDVEARAGELDGDRTPCTAGRARHERDPSPAAAPVSVTSTQLRGFGTPSGFQMTSQRWPSGS
jgi:hypothetical protein